MINNMDMYMNNKIMMTVDAIINDLNEMDDIYDTIKPKPRKKVVKKTNVNINKIQIINNQQDDIDDMNESTPRLKVVKKPKLKSTAKAIVVDDAQEEQEKYTKINKVDDEKKYGTTLFEFRIEVKDKSCMRKYLPTTRSYYCNDISKLYENKNGIIQLVIKLDGMGYEFKDKEYDALITCMTAGKRFSFLYNETYVHKSYENNPQRIEFLKIMFTKYKPNDKQLHAIFNCSDKSNRSSNKLTYWISLMIENGVNLELYINKLITMGYDVTKVYGNKEMSKEQLMVFLKTINYHTMDVKMVEKILQTHILLFDVDMFKCIYDNDNIGVDDYVIRMITNMMVNIINLSKFDILSHSDEIIQYILQSKKTRVRFWLFNIKPTIELFEYFAKYYINNYNSKYGVNDTFDILMSFLIEGIKPNENILNNYIVSHGVILISDDDINRQSKYDMLASIGMSVDDIKKLEIVPRDTSVVPDVSMNKTMTFGLLSVINLFEYFNVVPTIDTLYAIVHSYFKYTVRQYAGVTNVMIYIMDKYNIIPTDLLLREYHRIALNNGIKYMLDKKINISSETFQSCYFRRDILDLFFEYGYVLTLQDVEYCLARDVHFECLERFDIKYDEELFFVCYKVDKFPSCYIENIKKNVGNDIVALRLDLHDNKIRIVDDFIKRIKRVKLDRYCFDFAVKKNQSISDFMINTLNLPFTCTFCFDKNYNRYINKYYKQFGINKEYMTAQYDFDLALLEKN